MYFWVFRIIYLKKRIKIDLEANMIKIDPGAVDFTSGFSQENSIRWVNKLLLGYWSNFK